jgi:ribosomal protein L10
MDKAGKAVALEAYKEVFADAGVIVVTQYSGLTVTQLTDLRVKLKAQGANLKVIKNRLAKIALDGRGGEAAGAMFVGPVAIAFSPDPVAASKVVADFAKGNEKLVLVGALMGDQVLATIAHDLVEAIRGSVSIDWTQKEAVRADMRRKVKKLLRKHGYPPDKQENAVLMVIEQVYRPS